MERLNLPGYEKYGAVYLIAASLLVTILFESKSTHPGLVLGLVAIILGIQLFHRALRAHPSALLPIAITFVFMEIVAIIVVIIGWDPRESWITTWLALSSIGLMLDELARGRSKRADDAGWW